MITEWFARDAEELKKILPPPQNVPAVNWGEATRDLRHPLPDDFTWFCDTYGAGTINDYVWVCHPGFCAGRTIKEGLAGIHQRVQEFIDRNSKNDYDPIVGDVDPVFKSMENLLCCGGDDNGTYFLWKTVGAPEKWEIAVVDNKGYFFNSGTIGIVAFLLSLVTKTSMLMDRVIAGSCFDDSKFIAAK